MLEAIGHLHPVLVHFPLAPLAWREGVKDWPGGWLSGFLLLSGSAHLGITGFPGGHLSFRHGLGVQSLPVFEGEGHAHGSEDHPHAEAAKRMQAPPAPSETPAKTAPKPHPHDGTPHKH